MTNWHLDNPNNIKIESFERDEDDDIPVILPTGFYKIDKLGWCIKDGDDLKKKIEELKVKYNKYMGK